MAVAFGGGVAGSLHCLGMCGGFAAIIGQGERGRTRTVLYNVGRVLSLTTIGAMAGAFGGAVEATGLVFASRGLAIVGGGLMIIVALEIMGVPLGVGRVLARVVQVGAESPIRAVLETPSPLAPLAFGVLNAWLPCHLIWAFVAQAVTSGSPMSGAAVMLAFGLGTVPAMVAGSGASRAVARMGSWAPRIAGALVIAAGAITVARGLGVLPGHLEHRQHHGGHHEFHQPDEDRRGE